MDFNLKAGDRVRLDFDALARLEGATPLRNMQPSQKLGIVVHIKPPYVVVDWGIWAWPQKVHHSALLLLEEQIENKNITNIMTLLADATEQIDIDDYSVDLCSMATVLHDFGEANQTDPVLKAIKTLLRHGGCLDVIEFKKIEGPPGPPIQIRLSEDEVEKMVTGYGFKKTKVADIGAYNYLMTFSSR